MKTNQSLIAPYSLREFMEKFFQEWDKFLIKWSPLRPGEAEEEEELKQELPNFMNIFKDKEFEAFEVIANALAREHWHFRSLRDMRSYYRLDEMSPASFCAILLENEFFVRFHSFVVASEPIKEFFFRKKIYQDVAIEG